MALCFSVNILYELCTDTCSDVFDDRKTEILDSGTDVPTISTVVTSSLCFY
jgi:hypothetical protein